MRHNLVLHGHLVHEAILVVCRYDDWVSSPRLTVLLYNHLLLLLLRILLELPLLVLAGLQRGMGLVEFSLDFAGLHHWDTSGDRQHLRE